MSEPPLSAAEHVDHLLNRIGEIDADGPELRAVLCVDPRAMDRAIECDAEQRDGRSRGPLHGVPVLVKDTIDTADLPTTAGSLALAGSPPAHDAAVVTRLRDAGAIVLGKTNLSEWANFRSPHSTSGWSAVGGLTRNPWALDRSAGGSSSGSAAAVAAGLAPLAVGSETDGSIVCPASVNGVVGVKPTVGLVPRQGIVPISHSQDSVGPMARTVHEAATLLDVLAAADHYAAVCTEETATGGLARARIGVARAYFGDHGPTDAVAEQVLTLLSRAGATLVDPADVPIDDVEELEADELTVLLHEFRAGLRTYLAHRPGDHPATLDALVAFNREHAERELAWFGQEYLVQAANLGPLDESPYADALARGHRRTREQGIDRVLREHELDALVAPAFPPAWKSDLVNGDQGVGGRCTTAPAVAGYPVVCLPMGLVHGLPVGLALLGTAGSEPVLLRLAHAAEHALGLAAADAWQPTFPPPQLG